MMQRVKRWMRVRSWLAKGIVIALAVAALVALLPLGIGAFALTPYRTATSSGWTISHDATGGALNHSLSAAATITSNDSWVAGDNFASGTPKTLLEHWNGVKWSIVGSPNPGNAGDYITAMSADRSTDVWAVGYYYTTSTGSTTFPLVEHWNGVRWYSIFSPIPPHAKGVDLIAVASLAGNDAWIAGNYSIGEGQPLQFLEKWNGTRWSFVVLPDPGIPYQLNALKGISGSNVWAVGTGSSSGRDQPFAIHWDGVRWSVVPMAAAGYAGRIYGIVAITPSDIWAVGAGFPNSNSIERSLAEHWNGSHWQVVYTPTINPREDTLLTGVGATSSNAVWAVGYIIPGSDSVFGAPFIDQWNGEKWTAVSIPVGPPTANSAKLLGVSATPEGGVWAVGNLTPLKSQNVETLILRHS